MTDNEMKLRYQGSGGDLLLLMLGNAILTLLTLGFYNFWARTKVRQFHWSHTDLGGDRFAYHGTGGELLRGYLKASGIVIVVAFGLGIVQALIGEDLAIAQVVVTLLVYGLIAVFSVWAVNASRRYRLSRSSWRGIRFSYHGDFKAFFEMIMIGGLLSSLTLGIYLPWYINKRRAFLVNNARFGSEQFQYNAPPDPLVKEFFKAVILTIPTLGFYWVWYSAFQHRYFWCNTYIGSARFDSRVTGGELLGFSLVNMLLIIFTAGLATPWVMTRTQAFWADQLTLVGAVDWASIQQRAQEAGAMGEGLADAMDVDVGFEA